MRAGGACVPRLTAECGRVLVKSSGNQRIRANPYATAVILAHRRRCRREDLKPRRRLCFHPAELLLRRARLCAEPASPPFFSVFLRFSRGGSLSLRPVSPVFRLEVHRIPLVRWLIPYLIPLYMRVFEFCLSLLFAPPGALPKTTLKSDALLHDAAGRRW